MPPVNVMASIPPVDTAIEAIACVTGGARRRSPAGPRVTGGGGPFDRLHVTGSAQRQQPGLVLEGVVEVVHADPLVEEPHEHADVDAA